MYKVLDLFSGVGGFSLGLERTGGFQTEAFCEIDPFCRKVLAKHWPNVRQYEDVRELTADRLDADGIVPDVICGGFPCQDISFAGKGRGIEGERSGLWFEYQRLIDEIRPQWVLVENVPALRSRGLDQVLGALSAIGYNAEWHCIPAGAIGAPHVRDRIWIVAHPNGQGKHVEPLDAEVARIPEALANTGGIRLPEREGLLSRGQISDAAASAPRQWNDMSEVGRAVPGLPNRVDRLRALGNAAVPQIPELIGRAILEAQHGHG
jgi:DNA (cytosine-5)-methyltransferase 1